MSPEKLFGYVGRSLLFSGNLIYYNRNGTVSGYIAGCSETIHCNVKCDHQRLQCLIETEHTLQQSQCRHDRSSRNSRCGYHRYTQHHDESCHSGKGDRFSGHVHDRHGAGRDLHRTSGKMDGRAERHYKNSDCLADTVLYRLGQCHGNSGG